MDCVAIVSVLTCATLYTSQHNPYTCVRSQAYCVYVAVVVVVVVAVDDDPNAYDRAYYDYDDVCIYHTVS